MNISSCHFHGCVARGSSARGCICCAPQGSAAFTMQADLVACIISECAADEGGALYLQDGFVLTVRQTHLLRNSAPRGSAIIVDATSHVSTALLIITPSCDNGTSVIDSPNPLALRGLSIVTTECPTVPFDFGSSLACNATFPARTLPVTTTSLTNPTTHACGPSATCGTETVAPGLDTVVCSCNDSSYPASSSSDAPYTDGCLLPLVSQPLLAELPANAKHTVLVTLTKTASVAPSEARSVKVTVSGTAWEQSLQSYTWQLLDAQSLPSWLTVHQSGGRLPKNVDTAASGLRSRTFYLALNISSFNISEQVQPYEAELTVALQLPSAQQPPDQLSTMQNQSIPVQLYVNAVPVAARCSVEQQKQMTVGATDSFSLTTRDIDGLKVLTAYDFEATARCIAGECLGVVASAEDAPSFLPPADGVYQV